MDSREEELQKIIMQSKINEARDQARRKAQSISEQKRSQRRMEARGGGGGGDDGGGRGGGGGGGGASGGGDSGYGGASKKAAYQPKTHAKPEAVAAAAAAAKPSGVRAGGMKLGKAKKTDDFFGALAKEDCLQAYVAPVGTAAAGGGGAAAEATAVALDEVHIGVSEKLDCQLLRDGGVKKLEVKGEMKLSVFDPDNGRIVVKTTGPFSKDAGFQARLHPKVDKAAWAADGTIKLKDGSKSFPVGADNAAMVLKWRVVTKDESLIPFSINFWPNEEDGKSVISCEIEQVGSPFNHACPVASVNPSIAYLPLLPNTHFLLPFYSFRCSNTTQSRARTSSSPFRVRPASRPR
jgi:hypothetical protein